MAIQFISDLPATKTLNAFNNNEVVFSVTGPDTPIQATITAGTASVTVTPDASGRFHFNFKEIFKVLVNRNHFRDTGVINFSTSPGYVFRLTDTGAFRQVLVNYIIETESGETHTATRQYKVLRAVTQLSDYLSGMTNDGNQVALLTPFTKDAKVFHATYFDGYPFDLSMLLNTIQNITIKNKTTDYQIQVAGRIGINRLIFSNGISNVTLEDILPLAEGVNVIDFVPDSISSQRHKVTLVLTKKKECSGLMLKWLNDHGGWSYFLFTENKKELDYREVASYPNNYGNIQNTTSLLTSLGYEKTKSIQLYADQLTREEKRYVNTLFGSPKVYMYLNKTFQKAREKSFIEVRVSGNKITEETRYHRTYDFLFDINQPYQNNFTM